MNNRREPPQCRDIQAGHHTLSMESSPIYMRGPVHSGCRPWVHEQGRVSGHSPSRMTTPSPQGFSKCFEPASSRTRGVDVARSDRSVYITARGEQLEIHTDDQMARLLKQHCAGSQEPGRHNIQSGTADTTRCPFIGSINFILLFAVV